jgi:hypothetical protein
LVVETKALLMNRGEEPLMIETNRQIKSTPLGIRTPNLLIRSQTLYPIELRARAIKPSIKLFIPRLPRKKFNFFRNRDFIEAR